MENTPAITKRIRERAAGRYSMPQLAVLSGLTPSTLYRRLVSGDFRAPEVDRIARTLGCKPADLFS